MTTEEFVDEQKRAVCLLPVEFQAVLCGMAWESGHSAGYEEIISHLRELADSLRKPIDQYTARIRRECEPDRRF